MMVVFAKTFMWLVRIGGENRWTLYDFDAVVPFFCKKMRNVWKNIFIFVPCIVPVSRSAEKD